MANIWQVTYQWSGTTGGLGYTNLYFEAVAATGAEALGAVNKAHTLFQGMAAYVPNLVQITPFTDVRLIEDTTGDLVNIFTVTGVSSIGGGAVASQYSGASGACIDWLTGVIHGKHLMTGRTFFVPLAALAYENNGTLADQTVTDIALAAEGFRTAAGPAFGVWGRPRKEQVPPNPNKPALTGQFARAIGSRVPDKAVVLRSRRD